MSCRVLSLVTKVKRHDFKNSLGVPGFRGASSGDIYEQAVVKTVAGFFRGNPKHLFGVTRIGAPGSYVRGRLQSA